MATLTVFSYSNSFYMGVFRLFITFYCIGVERHECTEEMLMISFTSSPQCASGSLINNLCLYCYTSVSDPSKAVLY